MTIIDVIALPFLVLAYIIEIFFKWPKRKCPKCKKYTSITKHAMSKLNGEKWFCNMCLNSYTLENEDKDETNFENPEQIL